MNSPAKRRRLLAAILAPAFITTSSLCMAATTSADVATPTIKETIENASLAGSFLAAQVASKDSDDTMAVAFYERAAQLDPDNVDLKQFLFLALTANGRIADAVEVGRQLPQTDDTAGVVRLVMAVHSLRQKSWAKVAGELGDNPESGELDRLVEQLIKAWASFGAGDVDKALEMVKELDGAEWANVVRDYHGGLIAAAAGRDGEAEALLQSATRDKAAAAVLAETYLRAVEALVRTQSRLGKFEEARQTLDEGLKLLATHPPFLALQKELAGAKALPLVVTSAQQGGEIGRAHV